MTAAARANGIGHSVFLRRLQYDGLVAPTYGGSRSPPTLKLTDLTSFDLGYLAAMIDGEGHICRILGPPRNAVRVGVTNTEKGVIDWLHGLGGNVYSYLPHDGRKRRYEWAVLGRLDALKLLQTVGPRLKIKRDQAEEAIQLLTGWLGRPT